MPAGQGAQQDRVTSLAIDQATGNMYTAGETFGAWPGELSASIYQQLQFVKILANCTFSYLRIQKPGPLQFQTGGIGYNSVLDQLYMGGRARGASIYQMWITSYASNGTLLWTIMEGSYGTVNRAFEYLEFGDNMLVSGYLRGLPYKGFAARLRSNGTFVWQTTVIEAQVVYNTIVQIDRNDGFAYWFGTLSQGTLDNKTYNGSSALLISRFSLADGVRDTTWSIVLSSAADLQSSYGIYDPTSSRFIAMGSTSTYGQLVSFNKDDGQLVSYQIVQSVGDLLFKPLSITSDRQLVYLLRVNGTIVLNVDSDTLLASGNQSMTFNSTETSSSLSNADASSTLVEPTFKPLEVVQFSKTVSGLMQVRTTMQQQSTVAQDQPQDIFGLSPQTVIVASSGLGFAVLLCAVLTAFVCMRRARRGKKRMNNTVAMSEENSTQMQDTSSMRSDLTAIATNHELSVPAFLMVSNGTDYRQEQEIARGAMGSVCMVHVYTGSQLSIRARTSQIVGKFANVPVKSMEERMSIAFYQELSLHWLFRDTPNFARIFGYSESPIAAIFMQFYPLGSLQQYIGSRGCVSAASQYQYSRLQVLKLLKDCAQAFTAMHLQDVVHCDIKPANVLLQVQEGDMYLHAIITDFGVARLLSSRQVLVQEFKESRMNGLSLVYAAPDALYRLRKQVRDVDPQVQKSGDVYSQSMVAYEMLCRKSPWSNQ